MADSMRSAARFPTFIIIGAQKSATRWLRTNLGEHPDIFTRRAPRCTSGTTATGSKKLGLDWYREQFEGWNGEPIVGEATPGYMIWRHHPALVAQRMNEHLPDVRLIAILRNPIDRAQSAMLHHIRRDRIPAGSRLVDVVRERRPPETDWFCLVSGGWYAASLEPFRRAVRRPAARAVPRRGRGRPGAPVPRRAASTSAPIPTSCPTTSSRVVFSNQRGRGRPRAARSPIDDRVELWEYFRDDVARLEQMLGVDLSRWAPEAAAIAAAATDGAGRRGLELQLGAVVVQELARVGCGEAARSRRASCVDALGRRSSAPARRRCRSARGRG